VTAGALVGGRVRDHAGGQWASLRAFACALALAGLALAWASPGGAAADGWTFQNVPMPSGAKSSGLGGVSCTSASACVAVGWYESTSGEGPPLAESWNGSTWTPQTVPAPSGAKGTLLEDVSCTSPSACTAVGFYSSGVEGEGVPLAESWNGSSWTLQSVPAPSGARAGGIDYLEGVSCVSARACVAVGRYEISSSEELPLAESWNGSSWTLQSVPAASAGKSSGLRGVSCTSASTCTAVGWYEMGPGSESGPFAESWNGSTWTPQTVPTPGGMWGGLPEYLDGVSCTSASACVAVGHFITTSPGEMEDAESWNGSTWTPQSVPLPIGPTDEAGLASVSCTSASACTAVGNDWGDEGYLPLAESWNGSTWTPQSFPIPSGAQEGGVFPEDVSCVSASACVAVGWYWGSSGEVAFAASSSGSPPQPPPPPSCTAGVCAVAPTFGPQSGGTPITITGGPFVSGNGYMVCFQRVGSYGGVCTGATVVNGTTLRAITPPRPVSDSPGAYLVSTEEITAGSGNLDIHISPSNVTFDFDATYQAPGDASLAGTGTLISLTTPHFPGEHGYASFQDANPAAVASDFHASIDWGDGTGTASATLAPVSIPGIAGTTSGTQTLSTLSLAPTTPLPNGSLFSVDAPAHDFANVAPGENEYDTWVTVTDSAGSFATMLTPVVITRPLPPHTQPVPHGPTATVEGALKTVDIGHTLYDCGVAIVAGGGPEDPFADGACLLSMAFSLDIEAVTGDDPPDSRVTAIPGVHHVHVRATCPRSRGARSRQCRRIAKETQSYLSASEVTAAIALAQAKAVDRFDTAVRRRNSPAAVLQRAVIYAYAGALLPAAQRQNTAAVVADHALTMARFTAHVTSHELLGDYRRLSHRFPPGLRALQARQHIPSLTKLLRPSLRKLEGGSQTQLLAPTLPLDGIEQIADETTLGGVLQIVSALRRQHAIATGDAASRLAGDIVSLGAPTSPALMQQFDRDLQLVQPAYRPLITGAVTALQDAAAHATPHLSPG
jgi:hypothetical protein